jgi:glycosyltransferase involved in cell wall biosynthesis
MMSPEADARTALVIEASPLWELQYTGIANVVYELVRRFAIGRSETYVVAFEKELPPELLRTCLEERSGRAIRENLASLPAMHDLIGRLKARSDLKGTIGLYLNTRPPHKLFGTEAMLFHDFSPLLTPECHTPERVAYHARDLTQQIAACDAMFCNSESTARDLSWIFDVPREKICVALLGHGVDVDIANMVQARIGGRSVEPYFVVLGTIEPRKNVALVLEWVSRHPEVLDQYRVVLAGRQGWGPSFASQIEQRSLEQRVADGRIVYMDYVDEHLKLALLVGASALIYPSLFEGFGLPVLEAMMVGAPVLSSVSTSLPEVLGDCGYYFDPYSIEALHGAFERFEADRASGRLATVRERAQARARTFTYDRTYEVVAGALSRIGASKHAEAAT